MINLTILLQEMHFVHCMYNISFHAFLPRVSPTKRVHLSTKPNPANLTSARMGGHLRQEWEVICACRGVISRRESICIQSSLPSVSRRRGRLTSQNHRLSDFFLRKAELRFETSKSE